MSPACLHMTVTSFFFLPLCAWQYHHHHHHHHQSQSRAQPSPCASQSNKRPVTVPATHAIRRKTRSVCFWSVWRKTSNSRRVVVINARPSAVVVIRTAHPRVSETSSDGQVLSDTQQSNPNRQVPLPPTEPSAHLSPHPWHQQREGKLTPLRILVC